MIVFLLSLTMHKNSRLGTRPYGYLFILNRSKIAYSGFKSFTRSLFSVKYIEKLYSVSSDIAKCLLKSNKISCFRAYIFMQYELAGKYHNRYIDKVAKFLKVHVQTVRKMIRQLIRLGLIEKRNKGWYCLVSPKRLLFQIGKTTTQMIYIHPSSIKCIKRLRTKLMSCMHAVCAKIVSRTQPETSDGAAKVTVKLALSYVQKYMNNKSISTISKHRKRAKQFRFLDYNLKYQAIYSGSRDECYDTMSLIRKDENYQHMYRIGRNRNGIWEVWKCLTTEVTITKPRKRTYCPTKPEWLDIKFIRSKYRTPHHSH